MPDTVIGPDSGQQLSLAKITQAAAGIQKREALAPAGRSG